MVVPQSDWHMTTCLTLEGDRMWTADGDDKVQLEEEAGFPKECDFSGPDGGIGVVVASVAVNLLDLLYKKGRGHSEEDCEVVVCVNLQPLVLS